MPWLHTPRVRLLAATGTKLRQRIRMAYAAVGHSHTGSSCLALASMATSADQTDARREHLGPSLRDMAPSDAVAGCAQSPQATVGEGRSLCFMWLHG